MNDSQVLLNVTGQLLLEVISIEQDDRFHYEPAQVQINAPLALIQVDLKARHRLAISLLKLIGEQTDNPNVLKVVRTAP